MVISSVLFRTQKKRTPRGVFLCELTSNIFRDILIKTIFAEEKMKNLEEFLYKFKDTEQEIPCSFTNTIKNFSPKSQESRKIIMKISTMKKII